MIKVESDNESLMKEQTCKSYQGHASTEGDRSNNSLRATGATELYRGELYRAGVPENKRENFPSTESL